MSSKTSIETFFYIGHEKLSLYVFDGIDKKIFVKEILINNFNKKKNLNNSIDEFLRDNIIKIEKKINKFVNDINLIISDTNFVLIQASIKKNGKGDKIYKKDLNYMLFDLKQQIKENNMDKTITYMKINNFIVDNKKYLSINDNFECSELSLHVDFTCLSNEIIDNFSKKIKKYQIRIDKIFSAEYLKENFENYSGNECQIAAKLKYENDENEVHLISKTVEKIGFFESFFKIFN